MIVGTRSPGPTRPPSRRRPLRRARARCRVAVAHGVASRGVDCVGAAQCDLSPRRAERPARAPVGAPRVRALRDLVAELGAHSEVGQKHRCGRGRYRQVRAEYAVARELAAYRRSRGHGDMEAPLQRGLRALESRVCHRDRVSTALRTNRVCGGIFQSKEWSEEFRQGICASSPLDADGRMATRCGSSVR